MPPNPEDPSKNSPHARSDVLSGELVKLVHALELQGAARSSATRLVINLCFSSLATQIGLLDAQMFASGLGQLDGSPQALRAWLLRVWGTFGETPRALVVPRSRREPPVLARQYVVFDRGGPPESDLQAVRGTATRGTAASEAVAVATERPANLAAGAELGALATAQARTTLSAPIRNRIATATSSLLAPISPPLEAPTGLPSSIPDGSLQPLAWFQKNWRQLDWTTVEPSLLGSLWERSLQTGVRRARGAHYTPRADVERLIVPTVIQPLREAWQAAQLSALNLALHGDPAAAAETLRAFQRSLTELRILDPACGTGNFLYVTMEHVQTLEHEVMQSLCGVSAKTCYTDEGAPDAAAQEGIAGVSVSPDGVSPDGVSSDSVSTDQTDFGPYRRLVQPDQFQGMELDAGAAQIAEVVLWFSWLQASLRLRGCLGENFAAQGQRADPNAARLLPPSVQVTDALISGWVSGSSTAARQTSWPIADYIVGNPPFIGARHIRSALGDDYVSALRTCYPEIPEHADLVMYWWSRAAIEVGEGRAKQFGFITTNSILQPFSKKVVDASFANYPSLELRHIITDHPWIRAGDGASVRVSLMTVGRRSEVSSAATNAPADAPADGSPALFGPVPSQHTPRFRKRVTPQPPLPTSALDALGVLRHAELSPELVASSRELESSRSAVSRVAVTSPVPPGLMARLDANRRLACVGYQLSGKGFVMSAEQADTFLSADSSLKAHIRPLFSGRDLMQTTRGLYAVDLYGLSLAAFRAAHPSLYRWLEPRVRAERQTNARQSLRDRWWIFGEARSTFRPLLVGREHIWVTSLTAKHRVFSSVPADWICDSTTVMFAIDDAQAAILSSRLHTAWSFAAGGTLEDRPRYNKSTCFETYPFPVLTPPQSKQLATIVRQIDALRWSWRAMLKGEHEKRLTITRAYNRMNAIGLGAPIDDGDSEDPATQTGNAAIRHLSDLHAALDRAVFAAYGWDDLAAALVGRPGATTPLVEMGAAERNAEADLLRRLAKLAETQGE